LRPRRAATASRGPLNADVRPHLRTLSEKHSPFIKRVLPFLVIAAAVGWTFWPDGHEKPEDYILAGGILLLASAIVYWILRKGIWRMADTVEDYGDALVVSRWKTRITLHLSDVRELRRERKLVGSEVTLVLSKPGPLGAEISFLAPDSRNVPDIDTTLETLAARISAKTL
jgi:hypothetical protein